MKYDTILKARYLRKTSTEAELLMWKMLRDRQFSGVKFRRQHPFPPYIVDFYCPSKKLIIELDGSQHLFQREYDQARSDWLVSSGNQVLRFWNHDFLSNPQRVMRVIAEHLDLPPSP